MLEITPDSDKIYALLSAELEGGHIALLPFFIPYRALQ